ncbi:hypothetical protein ACYSUW_13990 [Pseudomonas frederiksbergensis]
MSEVKRYRGAPENEFFSGMVVKEEDYDAAVLVGTGYRDERDSLQLQLAAAVEQLAHLNNLRGFANSMIDICFEGGNADGGQIQEYGVNHGLLKPEVRSDRCEGACACAEYGFPTECFRRTPALTGAPDNASQKPAIQD